MCVCSVVNTAVSLMNYTNDDSHIVQKKNNKENVEGLQDVCVLQFVNY